MKKKLKNILAILIILLIVGEVLPFGSGTRQAMGDIHGWRNDLDLGNRKWWK